MRATECIHDRRHPVAARSHLMHGVYGEVYSSVVEHQERRWWLQWEAASGSLLVAWWVSGNVEAFLSGPKEQNVMSVWVTQHQPRMAGVGQIYWSLSGVAVSALSHPFEGEQILPAKNEAVIERLMVVNGASEALVQC